MNEEVKFAVERAKAALISRDYEQSVKVLKNLLKKQPEALEALFLLGSVYMRSDKLNESQDVYETILNLEPDNSEAMNNLGIIYRRFKKYDESIVMLRRVADLGKEPESVYYNLGSTYKEMGKFIEAAECFEQVLNNKPDDVLAYNHLGKIYEASGSYDKAMSAYARGLQIDQNHPILHYNMALALESDGKLLESEGAYLSALRSKPGWVEAMKSYAKLLIKTKRVDDAEDILQQALTFDEKNNALLTDLATVYIAQEKIEDAKGLYKKALKIDENSPDALRGLELLYEKEGDLENALKTIKKLESVQPNDSDMLLQYAKLLLKLDSVDEAQKRIASVLENENENVNALRLMGRCHAVQGETEKAQGYFSKILEIDPNNADFRMDMAEHLFAAKDFVGCEKQLRQYLASKPNDVDALLMLGNVYEALKNIEKAVDCYRKILRIDSKNAHIMTAISRLFNENGQNAQAIRLFEELVNAHSSNQSMDDLKGFSASLQEYENALENFEKLHAGQVERNIRKLKNNPISEEIDIDSIPVDEEFSLEDELDLGDDITFEEVSLDDLLGEEVSLDMFLNDDPIEEANPDFESLSDLVNDDMPIEEEPLEDEREEEETVMLDEQDEEFLSQELPADSLQLEDESTKSDKEEIEEEGEEDNCIDEMLGLEALEVPSDDFDEDKENTTLPTPKALPDHEKPVHKKQAEGNLPVASDVLPEVVKTLKPVSNETEFPHIDLAEELLRVPRDNPFFEVIEMLIFLKYLTESLPYDVKKQFFSSADRVRLEYIIEHLIGGHGLLQEAEGNTASNTDHTPPCSVSKNEQSLLAGTLDYLRSMAQDLPDKYLASALEAKVDTVLSLIKSE